MTKPRAQQISLTATPYYHCVSRCVRQAFLCGINYKTLQSYEHRREWLEHELLNLSQIFMIKIASYAIMSNHYHVILAVNTQGAKQLSDKQVVKKWHQLFSSTPITQDFIEGKGILPSLQPLLFQTINKWRNRLISISWFMRCLNEKIARKANKEDKCTGRFWEGRFKSQALIGEKALLSCMAYVDLNPIRAKMAQSLENSEHTAIKRRLAITKGEKIINSTAQLMPFSDENISTNSLALPIKLYDYIELVDWSGRQIKEGKKGVIVGDKPKVLDSLHFSDEHWIYLTQNYESEFKTIVGTLLHLKFAYKHFSVKRIAGKFSCMKYLTT